MDELLLRYHAGERRFERLTLLYDKLRKVTLSNSHFIDCDFRFNDWRSTDFTECEFIQTSLGGGKLAGAKFDGAKFIQSDLEISDLRSASMREARLISTRVSSADLRRTDLTKAKIQDVNFQGSDLTRCVLAGAQVESASLNGTYLLDLNLEPFLHGAITHEGPSFVDYNSVVRTVHAQAVKPFLRACGMPDVFVEYMFDCARSLSPEVLFSLLQSTFISYGGPDEAFARKLNGALEAAGVTTFFFKDDAVPGEKLHRMMRKGINEHDRVILVCSEQSLQRPGVLNELEETLAREARDGGNEYLIPVRLDDYVFSEWRPKHDDVAQTVRDRVIADFRDHADPARFNAELAKLVAALKKPPTTTIVNT